MQIGERECERKRLDFARGPKIIIILCFVFAKPAAANRFSFRYLRRLFRPNQSFRSKNMPPPPRAAFARGQPIRSRSPSGWLAGWLAILALVCSVMARRLTGSNLFLLLALILPPPAPAASRRAPQDGRRRRRSLPVDRPAGWLLAGWSGGARLEPA